MTCNACTNNIHERHVPTFQTSRGQRNCTCVGCNGSVFASIKPGDILSVRYQGSQVALMQVEEVRTYAIEGKDGGEHCKVTSVGCELRFYATIRSNWLSTLRNVQIVPLTENRMNHPESLEFSRRDMEAD